MAVLTMRDALNLALKEELERDPIKLFTATLKKENILSDKDLAAIEAEVKEQVEQSVRFAEESPEPDPSELYTNINASPLG